MMNDRDICVAYLIDEYIMRYYHICSLNHVKMWTLNWELPAREWMLAGSSQWSVHIIFVVVDNLKYLFELRYLCTWWIYEVFVYHIQTDHHMLQSIPLVDVRPSHCELVAHLHQTDCVWQMDTWSNAQIHLTHADLHIRAKVNPQVNISGVHRVFAHKD